MGRVPSKMAGVNWLVSPPIKPKNCSKPSPVGQRSKGPAWLVRVPVYGMGAIAAYWCLDRTAGLFYF